MININQQLIDHIQREYHFKVLQVIKEGSVLKLKTKKKYYMLKKMRNKKVIKIYNFLLSQKFNNFIIPVATINNELYTKYKNQEYYLTPWFDNIDYPVEKKLIDYIDLLKHLHQSTTIHKKFNKAQFVRLYKKRMKALNIQFQLLDYYIIECESKRNKSIFDWTYLTKYNEIMYIKNVLLKIQQQIEDLLEDIDKYDYCIIHNNTNIDHFIVTNEKNYLISFDYSTIGFKVHDYIKLFIEYSEYDVDWMNLINSDNIEPFEFYYFIFNVLYYIIKNIEITFLSNNYPFEAINILMHNLYVSSKAVELYQKYDSINSSTETLDE